MTFKMFCQLKRLKKIQKTSREGQLRLITRKQLVIKPFEIFYFSVKDKNFKLKNSIAMKKKGKLFQ